ncbi:hypothetical protein RND71_016065 [Anisodus tanguticus]|uniref:Uncharacterized protein n=1 Tax=Anisodus tanguticus TaxID=243964 RepID=A0AAE1S7T7_9SOLA|nr:hypothetical protein RND71_016065 [Anisodus tanguticus]
MVFKLRPFCTLLLILVSTFSSSVHSSSVVHVKQGTRHVHGVHQRWQKETWMNHGSNRGPRKHLVNPTINHRFDIPELPV